MMELLVPKWHATSLYGQPAGGSRVLAWEVRAAAARATSSVQNYRESESAAGVSVLLKRQLQRHVNAATGSADLGNHIIGTSNTHRDLRVSERQIQRSARERC